MNGRALGLLLAAALLCAAATGCGTAPSTEGAADAPAAGTAETREEEAAGPQGNGTAGPQDGGTEKPQESQAGDPRKDEVETPQKDEPTEPQAGEVEAPQEDGAAETPAEETGTPRADGAAEPDAEKPSLPTAEDVEAGGDAWIVWEDLFLQGVALLETEELDGLRYGQTEAQVEALWGAPAEKSAPEVWAADGLAHTRWTYDGAELSFADGALCTASLTTPRPGRTLAGVSLGSTAEEVREAYGDLLDKESSTEGQLIAGSVYSGLVFTLEEGTVTAIFLGAAAE